MVFIILSNQQFDFELKTNKWHVAKQLVEKGHKVIFVDPPLRFKALKSIASPIDQKSDRLVVYKPLNLFNFKPFSSVNTYRHLKVITKLLQNFAADKEPVVLYIYHFDFPDLRDFVAKVQHTVSVYDCVDEYAAFPEYVSRKKVSPSVISWLQWVDDELKIKLNQNGLQKADWVTAQEKWLCDSVGLVFASAPGLVEKLKKWRGDVHYLPNAAAIDKFDHAQKLPEPVDLKDIPHPIIGFSGAIDTYKNNIGLIEKCAKIYPDYHFVMIGPEKVSDPDLDLATLKSMANVHFLGIKPWEDLPAYFDYFDAYFIPYNINDYTRGCHPVKYFEGLAAGLPTLITLNSVKEFDVDGYVTEDEAEFISNLKKAVTENSNKKVQKRKALARENSWSGKVNKQLEFINDELQGKFQTTSGNR